MSLSIGKPWKTVDDVVRGLAGLEVVFTAASPLDRRGIFVTAYLEITREIASRIQAGGFADNEWVGRYVVAFGDLYRDALFAYESSPQGNLPIAWRLALEASLDPGVSELQLLALGINAHIFNDLPLALVAVDVVDGREADHNAVNEALAAAIDNVQDRLATLYNPVLRWFDWAGGKFDELFTMLHFESSRKAAWESALALRDGQKTKPAIAAEAEARARDLLALREILGSTTVADLVLLLVQVLRPSGEAGVHAVGEQAPPPGLATAIRALEAEVEGLDRDHSRLALLPAVHAELLGAVGHALNRGRFRDPAWVTAVAAGTAAELLRALGSFRAGELERTPASWGLPMRLAQRDDERSCRAGSLTAPQIIALAANAVARHDLPISLFRQGLRSETADSRRQDHAELAVQMGAVVQQALLAATARYAGYSLAVDGFRGLMDELLDGFSFTEAAAAGFAQALNLADARHDAAARSEAFRGLDLAAATAAQLIGVRPLARGHWLARALNVSEQRWTRPWSEWLRGKDEATSWRHLLGRRFESLPLPLRVILGERSERRVRGAARAVQPAPWMLEAIFDRLGLPADARQHSIRLEGVVDGATEHWLQILGGRVLSTRQWTENGLLAVAFDPWRFRFRVDGNSERLLLEQYDASIALLPVPSLFAPKVAVEVKVVKEGLEVSVTVDAPLLGRVVDYQASLRPE